MAPPRKTPKYDTQIRRTRSRPAGAPPLSAAPPSGGAPHRGRSARCPRLPRRRTRSTPAVASDTARIESRRAIGRPGHAVGASGARRLCRATRAFSDDKGANALANRLKRSVIRVHRAAQDKSRHIVARARRPYPSRDAATGVRDKLKAEGQKRHRGIGEMSARPSRFRAAAF
jgi:hypothetical protein